MRSRLTFILRYYVILVAVFILQKPLFMLYNWGFDGRVMTGTASPWLTA